MAEALFQRASPCKFCENPAQHQCQNCDDPLCNSCKKTHEREKPNHKYVPYSQKAQRICTIHNDLKYIFWCQECTEACCTKCSITTHKRHDMIDIENAILTKQEELKKDLKGPLKESLKEWQLLCIEARQMTKEFTTNIRKMDEQLVSHSVRIHNAVGKNLAKVREELQEMGKSTEAVLQKQEKEVNDRCEEIKRTLNKAEDYIESNDINILFECNFQPDDKAALPILARHSSPRYSPGQINDQAIMVMVGQLSSINQCFSEDDFSNKAEATCTVRYSPPSSDPISSTPVVVSSFNPRYDCPHIVCTTSPGLAWVKTANALLQLMDRHGNVKDTIRTDFGFYDITVTPHGDVLFSDFFNHRIMSASKGMTSWRVKSLFSTQYKPWGICCLRNSDVIVTYPYLSDHYVIQHNKEGAIVHKYDSDMFSGPYTAAVNKVNDNLYISDGDKQNIYVFGKNHRLLHVYNGFDSKLLDPREVSTDIWGCALITDYETNRIHILDKDGKFIRYLQLPGLTKPCYLDVDSEGNAWIGEYEGQVKIVKYCNTAERAKTVINDHTLSFPRYYDI